MLWLLLAEAMVMPGFDGVLPFTDPRRVSLLVSESQTEVETHLETLIAEQLILREGETLVCPMLREASARTAANRRNGAGGGRPRKGETAEEMHRRRQRELILPIEGGAPEKPTETERWNTPSAGAVRRLPLVEEQPGGRAAQHHGPGRACRAAGEPGAADVIRLSVRQDYLRLHHTLTDFERRQLPFAAARALTRMAQEAGREVERGLPSTFDRPTPFTLNALGVTSARKTRLEAVTFVKRWQAAYLKLQEQGGMRRPKRRALVNPAGVKLNQYGNIPNKALARLKRRRDVFVGKVAGIGGVWQRPKGKAKASGKPVLLIRFDGPRQVRSHPFFAPRVAAVVRRAWVPSMRDALAEALRTARR